MMTYFFHDYKRLINIYLNTSSQLPTLHQNKTIDFSILQPENDNFCPTNKEILDPTSRNKIQESHVCREILLFLPGVDFANYGHGSQLNNYIAASMIATSMGLPMLLLEPPLKKQKFKKGSQFGCPPVIASLPKGADITKFPSGLSRLIDHPRWLSHGCSIPSCPQIQDYDKLVKSIAEGGYRIAHFHCQDSNRSGNATKVYVTAAYNVRSRLQYLNDALEKGDIFRDQVQLWALSLGSSIEEAEHVSNISDTQQFWNLAMALMNRSGILRLQPWIIRDVESRIKSFDLPFLQDQLDIDYDAIHIRRGDKLLEESKEEVDQYWRSRGHDHPPVNYIPFVHYLRHYVSSDCISQGVKTIYRNVYVATDDPMIVKEEIKNLTKVNGTEDGTLLVDGCYSLKFHFHPTQSNATAEMFHIQHGGPKGDCVSRYERSIAALSDLVILSRSSTFVGEYNSNWGRLVRLMRISMSNCVKKENGIMGVNERIRIKDVRVAFGSETPLPSGL
ncbi:hypothetical protein ACHAXS_010216 [Conticribra weissflogii]